MIAIEQICWDCGKPKPLSDFHKHATKKNGVETQCKVCGNAYMGKWNKQAYTIEKGRQYNLRRLYGIAPEVYQALFEAQQGVCVICGQPETAIDSRTKVIANLHVDHDHKTGKIRALLCRACNTAYGMLNEDPERIRALLRYAEGVLL